MNDKTRIFIFISVFAGIAILLFSIRFISSSIFRKGLPEYPDFDNISVVVKYQILTEGRKTFWNPSEENLGMLGMVYNSCGYYDKASQCYKLAIKKNSLNWRWNYYDGYLNMEMGDSQASIDNFYKVSEKNPSNILALYYTAEAYQNIGAISNAEVLYKKVAVMNEGKYIKRDTIRENEFPLQTYASFSLARIYINSNRLDSAEITLKNIIEKQITFGPAYRLLGGVYTRQGNITLGNKFNTCANDLADYMPPPDMLIDKIALISRSDEYLLKQIDDEIRNSNYKWALTLCTHALKFNPDNKYLISKTIFGYFVLGMNKKALPYLNKHIKYYGDDYNELMHLANLLFDKGYDLQAMNYFNQAKKLKPENSRLALWLLERGMENEAISLLNEQLKKDPGNVKILTDAADFMLRLGNNEMAKGYLDHVEKLSPSNLEAKKLIGTIAERKGNLKKAISIYEDALRTDQKDLNNIKYLSVMYIRKNMWEKALDNFKLALVSYPNEPFLLSGLGNLMITCPDPLIRNNNEGIEYSERAFINYKSTFATKVSAGKDLSLAYATKGDKQKASSYIDLTINLARRNNIPLDIGYLNNIRKRFSIPE